MVYHNGRQVCCSHRRGQVYADILSFFRGEGPVEQLGPGLKFTGKAYVVFKDVDAARTSALGLSADEVVVVALGPDKTEYHAHQ